MLSPKENSELPDFAPERAHMELQGFYRDVLHHNNGSHLGRGVLDDDVWKRCWRRLVAQLASWQATPSGVVGLRFTSILVVEWQVVFDRSWNSERLLVFTASLSQRCWAYAGLGKSMRG